MTPTNEVRGRLNELGIEYEVTSDSCTTARIGGIEYNFMEYAIQGLFIITDYLTPEQAIAVTVGAGTCKRIYHPNRITKKCTCSNCGYGASDERWAYCPKCGHKYVHGEVEEWWKRAGRKVAE